MTQTPLANAYTIALNGSGVKDSADPTGAGGLSGGNAALNWSATSLDTGGSVDIATDGTYDFGTKPNDPKPLFYWDAETGQEPDSALGRASTWNGAFNGAESSLITSPDRTKSFVWDHNLSFERALGQVDFSSDELYVSRQKYDAFDITVGGLSFNYKMIRLWHEAGGATGFENNQYASAFGPDGYDMRTYPEYTGIGPATGFDGTQRPNIWVSEELVYKTGTVDVEDGVYTFMQNGQQFYFDTFRQRTSAQPNKYAQLWQGQVSNGTEFPAPAYYANLYVDDSYSRVVVSDNAVLTINTLAVSNTYIQPLPPSAWSGNAITVNVIGDVSGKYYHVINSSNTVIATGQFI